MQLVYPPGATPLDPSEIDGLIPNIALQSELNAREEENIIQARRWALASRNRRLQSGILSADNLRLLHRKMFENVWRWAGQYRRSEKNIGVSWYQIPSALLTLCEDVMTQLELRVYPLDECAARFHHRLVQIHPFPNGNGRHARLATDILLLSLGGEEFSWGRSNLINDSSPRADYISALRGADRGDIGQLLIFVRS